MKLNRIKKIRGHRIFSDFTWPAALEQFGRFNLIYGWNGSGKTTLSNLLRAVQLRESITEGDVSFEIDANVISGTALAAATLPDIRVFNRDSVARSVFESPGTSQLPPVFVLGEGSADLQRQVEDLKAKLPGLREEANRADQAAVEAEKKLTIFASNKAREIKNLLLAPGSAYNNYNLGDFKTNVAAPVNGPLIPLDADDYQQLVVLKGSQLKEPIALPPVPFPDLMALHQEAVELLRKTVASDVVADLVADPAIAAWVGQGLELHTHGGDATTCKFCTQPLQADRLRKLEAHFNDRFKAFSGDVDALQSRINQAAKAFDGVAFPAAKLLYADFEGEYERERKSLEVSIDGVRRALHALAKTVCVKKDRMFESLELGDFMLGIDGPRSDDVPAIHPLLTAVLAGLQAVAAFSGKGAFARLQGVIARHNARSAAFLDEVKAARRKLHDHEIALASPEWHELNSANAAAGDLKRGTAKAVTDSLFMITDLEADILQHRPIAERLNQDLIAYLGHDEIQVVPEKTGYRLVRRGVPAANLSEGERTAIAFLHFLRTLNDRSFDLKTGIVVVDDPISSLDSNSTHTAFGFLKEKLKDANQLFVLTHNFTFFRQVRNWFGHENAGRRRPGQPARFYVLRTHFEHGARGSKLEALDSFLRDYESEYHYLFKRVQLAAAVPLGQPLATYYEMPNLARKLLETFLVFKIPNKGSLHARLQEIAFPEPRRVRLLRFIDSHSHADQIGGGHDEAAALAEAPTVLQDLLDLIAKVDGDHFARMKSTLDALDVGQIPPTNIEAPG